MNLDLCSSLTKTLKNIKPYLNIRTRAKFSSIFLPFLVNQTQKHKHKPISGKNTNIYTNLATDHSCQSNTNPNISKNTNPSIHLQ